MKVKVIGEHKDSGREFKVRRMNLEAVVVNYPEGTGLYNYNYDEIELISEGEIDDFLISNKGMLKIKLNRGISIFFYKALKESLEEEVDEVLVDLNVLRDKYSVNKRGRWEKDLVCVINDKVPVQVVASGQNFKREGYNVTVTRVLVDDFLQSAKVEIKKIELEIARKEVLLARYGRAINKLKNKDENADILLLK